MSLIIVYIDEYRGLITPLRINWFWELQEEETQTIPGKQGFHRHTVGEWRREDKPKGSEAEKMKLKVRNPSRVATYNARTLAKEGQLF